MGLSLWTTTSSQSTDEPHSLRRPEGWLRPPLQSRGFLLRLGYREGQLAEVEGQRCAGGTAQGQHAIVGRHDFKAPDLRWSQERLTADKAPVFIHPVNDDQSLGRVIGPSAGEDLDDAVRKGALPAVLDDDGTVGILAFRNDADGPRGILLRPQGPRRLLILLRRWRDGVPPCFLPGRQLPLLAGGAGWPTTGSTPPTDQERRTGRSLPPTMRPQRPPTGA